MVRAERTATGASAVAAEALRVATGILVPVLRPLVGTQATGRTATAIAVTAAARLVGGPDVAPLGSVRPPIPAAPAALVGRVEEFVPDS